MIRITATAMLGLATILCGCVNHRYCLEPQGYEQAGSVPPLQSADGLQVQQSPGALVVPPAPKTGVPYGREEKLADGKTQVECLDQPPPMPKPQGNEITE